MVPFEWGAGKTFNFNNDILKQITIGAVGYAQWQVTNNQIHFTPANGVENSVMNRVENSRSQIYAAGPGISALTKYGYFTLSYYEEFGAKATPSGRQLMFSAAF
ncbi:MAG: transporter [Desulfobaccales bacterium]